MKVLLMGYIGHSNFGDDLLFSLAIDRIKGLKDVEVFVTNTDKDKDLNYLKVYYEELQILNFDNRLPINIFYSFDLILFIGGGVFFNYNVDFSFAKYLKSLIANFLRYKLPKNKGLKIGGIGLGIGPYLSSFAKKKDEFILRQFDFLGVRDHISWDNLDNVEWTNKHLANDLSLSLFSNNNFTRKETTNNEVIICPRSYKHHKKYEKHIDVLLELSEYLDKKGKLVHWVFLQEENELLYDKIREKSYKLTIWNKANIGIGVFMNLFSYAKCLITSRMHAVFLAGMNQLPFISIPIHPKIEYAAQMFYHDPLLIDPHGELENYIEAYRNIDKLTYNNSRIDNEIEKVNKLNTEFNQWLAEINENLS